MERSVSPLVEVDPGEDAGLAGNPRVDLVVRQHHCVHLQVVNYLAIVAKVTISMGIGFINHLLAKIHFL